MINFLKYKFINLSLSGALIAIAILSFIFNGFKPSVDFVGGSLLEFSVKQESVNKFSNDALKEEIGKVEGVQVSSVQKSSNDSFVIRMNAIDGLTKTKVENKLYEIYDGGTAVNKFDSVGPVLGRELLIKTALAVTIASLFIMFYVSWQFKDRIYGTAAILAMIHDVMILFGAFSVLGRFAGVEVDTLFVTAILTTLSFSVHDTIVVFDRIRERISSRTGEDLNSSFNKAVAQTLPRSLNNSMTIIFMLTALFVLGGETIRWFSFALLLGTVLGTYSSPFVAVPLLSIMLKRLKSKR
ncbi:MAG: protein translocase subunit SecF [Niabella sp.]|nr:MAG: protein translocase subunit SecF [Niabella sp.]